MCLLSDLNVCWMVASSSPEAAWLLLLLAAFSQLCFIPPSCSLILSYSPISFHPPQCSDTVITFCLFNNFSTHLHLSLFTTSSTLFSITCLLSPHTNPSVVSVPTFSMLSFLSSLSLATPSQLPSPSCSSWISCFQSQIAVAGSTTRDNSGSALTSCHLTWKTN